MPRVSRSRVIAAEPARVWALVSDPHSLPRWWPRTRRVEDVEGGDGRGGRWTVVLETDRGRSVRADYRCVDFLPNQRYSWSQDLEGTPFERILRRSRLEIGLRAKPPGTAVTLLSDEAPRGLARLGAPMLRGATRRRLDEALAGIDRALVGAFESDD